jgi:hypothetical protein
MTWSSLLWGLAGLGGLLAFFVVRGTVGGVALLVAGAAILVLGLGTAFNVGRLGDQATEEYVVDQRRLHRLLPFWPEPKPGPARSLNIFQGTVMAFIGLGWTVGGIGAILRWWSW